MTGVIGGAVAAAVGIAAGKEARYFCPFRGQYNTEKRGGAFEADGDIDGTNAGFVVL